MSGRQEAVAEAPVTSVLASDDVPVYDRKYDADEEALAALGYKAEFKREFSLWTSFCVSFAVLGLLPSFASTLYYVSAPEVANVMGDGALMAACSGHGLRGDTRHDMGLDRSHDLHSVRCNEHGRAMFRNADERRIILCCGSAGPSRMGSFGRMSAS